MSEKVTMSDMIDGMTNVESLVKIAKIAESSERYDDMARAMNRVTKLTGRLDETCRNLLSVAYKNVVGCRRSSWRVIRSVQEKAENKRQKELAENFRENIEKELQETCSEVLDLLNDYLIKEDCTAEEKVFYLKMRGDYWRYIAEYKTSPGEGADDNDNVVTCAEKAYCEALEHAKTNMKPAHPNRLGLALNFSVFYFEILKSPDKACQLAKDAFDNAITDIEENPPDDTYKDSTLIMQLLRDNLTLWTSRVEDENGDDL